MLRRRLPVNSNAPVLVDDSFVIMLAAWAGLPGECDIIAAIPSCMGVAQHIRFTLRTVRSTRDTCFSAMHAVVPVLISATHNVQRRSLGELFG